MKQSPVNKKIIIILENLEKSSLSELLGDFLAPLENRSTESPWTFQKGNKWQDHAQKEASFCEIILIILLLRVRVTPLVLS